MPTLGLVAVLGAFLLGRQLVAGRGKETPSDIKDILTAVVSGNWDGLTEVLSRKGGDSSGGAAVLGSVLAASPLDSAGVIQGPYAGSNALVNKMVALGHAASGYKLGATGPTYYDCSGLVWAAMKALNIYNGARFTTKNFATAANGIVGPVSNPAAGDIVVWPNHHMGVMSSGTVCYSAMSPSNGIGFASVTSITGSLSGLKPVYYRIKS